MKHMKGLPRRLTLPFVAGGLLALALCTSSESFGEPGVLSGSGAVRSLEAGINSYQEGAIEAAVETLSDALFQGELSQQQFAEAFYYRGLAYRELGKPGQAIGQGLLEESNRLFALWHQFRAGELSRPRLQEPFRAICSRATKFR